jgi:hypothetical protein
LAFGGCSNIIGISGYEIDPALDPKSPDVRGGSANAAGQPNDVSEAGASGAPEGGTSGSGGGGGTGAVSSEAGAAGETAAEPRDCESADDCDDTIDCTDDSCSDAGECEHVPNTERCDPSNCETCRAGIGCVAGPKQVTQLLKDPKFDESTSGWTQDGSNLIVSSALAISSPSLVQLGPAAADASEPLYSDVYQRVTIPAGTVALSLTFNFRFTPGQKTPKDEFAVLALYEPRSVNPFVAFYEFSGKDPSQPTWKQVTYKAPRAKVSRMLGKDFTFDLVAESFDGVYSFDNLQLDATICR